MSEADRVFPARRGQGARASRSEERLIPPAPRRGGPGGGARVVEVVHMRRDGPRPAEGGPRPVAARGLRAESWPEGFRARPPAPPLLPPRDLQPVAPEPAR